MGNTSSLIVQQIVSQALTAEELKVIPEAWWEKSALSEGVLQKLVNHWKQLVTRFGATGYTWEEALLAKGLTTETIDDFFVEASLKSECKKQWQAYFAWSSTLEEVLQSEVTELPAYFKTLKPPHWLGDQWSHLSPPLIVEMVWPWLSYLEESLEAVFKEAGVSFPEGWLSYAYGVLAFSSAPLYAHFYNRWSSLSPDIEEYELEQEVLNALSSKGMHESLWKQYPVWARVLATQTGQLLAIARQLLNHWSEDQAALIAEGWITKGVAWNRIEPGYSDPHEGGATAVIIVFEDGRKLVYKPRHLALEAQYVELTRFLREEWKDCGLSACRAMDGGDHGWMPFLAKEAPHFANELAPYHQHLGQLNALAYFLGASDLHPGNIIPQGIHPVPIDWECLLSPVEYGEGLTLDNTCLFTGLSPSWSVSLDRSHAYYSYGLAEGPRKWVSPLPQFVKEKQGKKWRVNYLEVKGFDRRQMWMLRHPQQHLSSFLEGFERMYRWLLDHRESPAWQERFWGIFTDAKSRHVLRPTQLYREALFYSLMPLHLGSGLQYGVALERAMVSHPMSSDDGISNISPIMDYEKQQLAQRDVPIFYGETNGTATYFGNGKKAPASLAKSPKAMAQQRLANASADQMRWQINCLESLYASIRISKEERRMIPTDARYLALHLAKAVESLRIYHPEGVRWPDWLPNGKNGTSLQTIIAPSSLHEGVDGNALFLIQAGHCFHHPSWLSLGKQALDYGRIEALKLLESSAQHLSPCAFTGTVFSSIYAHAYSYLQIEDTMLKEQLQQLLRALKNSGTACFDVSRHDYIGGLSSGLMLLSRLAIHPAFSEYQPWLKEWIKQWAFTLAEIAQKLELPKHSMAHGRAGWYLALHTAQKAIGGLQEFEGLLENWRELLVEALPEVQAQTHVSKTWWCAGLPGMAQALAVTADNETAQAEALQWLSVVEEMPAGALDHLCCGEAGRVYAVNTALRQLNRAPQIKSDYLLKRFSRHGQWQYQLFREGAIIPGAMVGAPGIGLALLQSLFPDKNPCIFTLEM